MALLRSAVGRRGIRVPESVPVADLRGEMVRRAPESREEWEGRVRDAVAACVAGGGARGAFWSEPETVSATLRAAAWLYEEWHAIRAGVLADVGAVAARAAGSK